MPSEIFERSIKSNIRLKKTTNARQERLRDLKEKYNIPLKWAEKLPVKERGMTDCLCLILFLLVCLTMIATTVYILVNSDPERLTRIYDSSGNDCGTGDVKDYPFLYMQTFKKPYRSVCVKECPRFDYNEIRFNSDGRLDKPEEETVQTDDGLDENETSTEQTTTDPSTDEQTTTDPSTDEQTTTDPSTDEQTTTDPSTDEQTTTDPSTNEQTTTNPSTDEQTTTDPSTNEQTTTTRRLEETTTSTTDASSETNNNTADSTATSDSATGTSTSDANAETTENTSDSTATAETTDANNNPDSTAESSATAESSDPNATNANQTETTAESTDSGTESTATSESADGSVSVSVGANADAGTDETTESETTAASNDDNQTTEEKEEEEERVPPSEPPLDKDGNLVPMYFNEFNTKWSGKPVTHTRNMSDEEIFGYSEGWVNGYFTEEQWEEYLTNRIALDCSPNNEVTQCNYKKGETWIYDSYPVLGLVCAPLAPKPALYFFRVSSKISHGTIGDILESWRVFVYVALISIGISLVFLVLTRYCGKMIIVILASITVIALLAGGIMVFVHYYVPSSSENTNAYLHLKYRTFLKRNKTIFIIAGVVSIILAFVLIIMLCKFRKELNLAYPILEIAAQCSISNIMLIFLSIFIIFCQFCVIFIEFYVIMRLYVMGEEHNDKEEGAPFVYYETTQKTHWLLALHVFGTYWIVIFLNNFNDFINSSISVNYYFDTRLKNINIFCHTLGHNCGSVAWTIVLLPTYLVNLVIGPIKWLVTSENPNALQNCCNKVFNCCCRCYEFFFDCISESFMPLCYMGSENFNVATRRHFFLTELYYDESNTVATLGTIYNWLGRAVITLLSGYCGILIIQNDDELEQNVKNMGLVFAVCFFISFVLGSLMINIFSTAYDSLFVCFLVEKNLFDQFKEEGRTYDLQARDDIERAFLKVINDSDDYQRLEDA